MPESANATAATVGPRGGSIRATGSDGTLYTLNVPASALTADTQITLTPINSIGNLPLDGGLLAAIDLQPSGLTFGLPASLVINLAADVPTLNAGFGWSGAANTFGAELATVAADRREVTLLVEHFSGYGLGIPGPSQLDALAAELIALHAEQDSAFEQLFDVASTQADADAFLIDWFDLIVQPRLSDGATNVAAALAAHQAWLTWDHLFALDGSPAALQSIHASGRAQNIDNLKEHFAAYTQPLCNGPVANWQDWLRVPDEIHIRAKSAFPELAAEIPALQKHSSISSLINPGSSCAELAVTAVNPPTTLGDQQSEVPLQFRAEIIHPAGKTPVAANITLEYDPGASGDETLLTDADTGLANLLVDRDLTWPTIQLTTKAVEASLGRDEVLSATNGVILGQSALRFFEVTTGPQPILAAGAQRTLSLVFSVDGVPVFGQDIALAVEGPGTLSADAVVTTDWLGGGELAAATVDYTAPPGAVIKNLVATVIASTNYNGENYQAKLVIYPYWVDLALRVNTGTALVDATNDSIAVVGDGPFAIHAVVTGAGATTADEPVPLDDPDDSVRFTAANPSESTLRADGGGTPSDLLFLPVESNGVAIAEWVADFAVAQADHVIEAIYYDGQTSNGFPLSVVAATVTLQHAAPTAVFVTHNLASIDKVDPQVATPIVFSTYYPDTSAPGANLWLDFDEVQGATLGAAGGLNDALGRFDTTITTNPSATCAKVHAFARTEPGGDVLGEMNYYPPIYAKVPGGLSITSAPRALFLTKEETPGVRVGATTTPSYVQNALVQNFCSTEAVATAVATAHLEAASSAPACAGGTWTGTLTQSATLQTGANLDDYEVNVSGRNEFTGASVCSALVDFYNQSVTDVRLPAASTATAFVTFIATAVQTDPDSSISIRLLKQTLEQAAANPQGSGTSDLVACLVANPLGTGPCDVGFPTSYSGTLEPGFVYRAFGRIINARDAEFSYTLNVTVNEPAP